VVGGMGIVEPLIHMVLGSMLVGLPGMVVVAHLDNTAVLAIVVG